MSMLSLPYAEMRRGFSQNILSKEIITLSNQILIQAASINISWMAFDMVSRVCSITD